MLHTVKGGLARSRALRAATITGLVGATFVAAPTATATDWTVTTADEYIAALAAASADDTGPHTITLGDNFRIRSSKGTPTYTGSQPLTIDGAGFTVRGEGLAGESLETPNLFLGMLPWATEGGDPSPGAITIENIRLRDFVDAGAIIVANAPLTVRDSVLFNNAAPVGLGAPVGSAISSAGGTTLTNVTVRDNVGGLGAVSDALATYSAMELGLGANTVTDSTFKTNVGLIGGAFLSINDATVTGSAFRENAVQGAGGAAALLGSHATVEGSTFVDNMVEYGEYEFFDAPAGGALVVSGEATIIDSSFSGNSAPLGGAIALMGNIGPEETTPSLSVTGSTLAENSADWAGGAIFAESEAPLTITDSTLKDNVAGEVGGAIYVDGSASVSGSVLARNMAEGPGGAIYSQQDVHATNSTFRANESGYNGGAIHAGFGTIDSSLFIGNTSASGAGAVNFWDGESLSSSVTNSTFTRNKSGDNYGAVAISSADSVEIAHSTFHDNRGTAPQHLTISASTDTAVTLTANAFTAGTKASCEISGPSAVTAYNFDADGTCTGEWSGTGDFGDGQDALLADVADNGGATWTHLPLEGSPLVDAVPLASCTVDVDQRGEVRPAGAGCDVGAVEVQPVTGDITFEIPTDKGVIRGVAKGAVSVDGIDWTSTFTGTPPAGVAFPLGLSSFTVHTATPGATVTIQLTLPSPANTVYKVTDGTWQEIDATIDGLTLTYTLTDGGALDEDGVANAAIVDPVAPGLAVSFTG